jgi:hypothetical protein
MNKPSSPRKPLSPEAEAERAMRQAGELDQLSEMGLAMARRFAEAAKRPGAGLDEVLRAADAIAQVSETMVRNIELSRRLMNAAEAARRRAEVEAEAPRVVPPAAQPAAPAEPLKSLRELAEDIRARRAATRYALGLPRPKPPTLH